LEVPIKDASCHPSNKNDAATPQVVKTIANIGKLCQSCALTNGKTKEGWQTQKIAA
jgi:hypothetical protein